MFRLPTCLEGPALGAPPRVCGGAQAVDIEIQAKEVVFRFKVRATLRVRGGAQAVDIEIQAKEIMYHKANLNRIMAECTSQPIEQIEEDTDRDRYMSPLEAKRYGIIDHIIGGDEAGFQATGSPTDFPKTKESYVNWGDLDDDGSQTGRFRGVPLEPFTKPLVESK